MVNNEDLSTAAAMSSLEPSTVQAAPRPRSCPRCRGRLFSQGTEGDRACFSCGNIVYGLPPLESLDVARRTPSHGGWRLT